jgi:hypothetical protein
LSWFSHKSLAACAALLPCSARLRIRILLTEIKDASELEKKATIKTLISRMPRLISVFGSPMGSVGSPTRKTSQQTLYHLTPRYATLSWAVSKEAGGDARHGFRAPRVVVSHFDATFGPHRIRPTENRKETTLVEAARPFAHASTLVSVFSPMIY